MSDEVRSGEVTLLIDRWLTLKAEGKQVNVEKLCEDAPHLVEPVKLELEALSKMDDLMDGAGDADSDQTIKDEHESNKDLASDPGNRQGIEEATTRLRIQKLHGRGGVSDVYLAFDETLQRPIAVKFLRRENSHSELFRQRLKREAEIASRLDHPGVVSIHWTGTENDGAPYYSMQFVAGKTLAEAIGDLHRSSGESKQATFKSSNAFVLRSRKLLNHFVDVCQTIAYAHQQQILHRDLKPANIVIGNFGETFVVDWGLAKAVDEKSDDPVVGQSTGENSQQDLTSLGSSIGTPSFMSPEQAQGDQPTTFASDVFNLGATLYNILTGMPPYRGDSLVEVLNAAESARFEPVRNINKRVPRALEAICHKAMAAVPENRYQSASKLAEDIELFLADETVSAYRDSWAEKVRRWTTKNRTKVMAIASSVIVALILLIAGNALLLNLNQQLANRETEAIRLQQQTQTALDQANQSLYSQLIALAHSELTKNNVQRADQILAQCPRELRQWEWRLLRWMVDRNQPVATLKTSGPQTEGLAFNGDGSLVAVGSSNGAIEIWQVDTWKLVTRLPGKVRVRSLAWSPDGQSVLACGSRANRAIIQRWDYVGQQILASRRGSARSINCMAISPDGQFVVTGESDGNIKIRRVDTLEPEVRIRPGNHRDQVNSITFDQTSNHFYSCGSDGLIFEWDMSGNRIAALPAHSGALNSIRSTKSGLVAACAKGIVAVLEKTDDAIQDKQWTMSTSAVAHIDHVLSVDIDPERNVVASGGLDRNVRLIDQETGDILETIQRHTSHVQKVRFDPTGKYLLTAGDDKIVQVWDNRKLATRIPRGRFTAYCSYQGKSQLVIVENRIAYLWDQDQATVIRRITDHPVELIGVVGGIEDVFATLYINGTVRIWNAANGQLLHQVGDPAYRAAYSGSFFDNGNQLAVGYQRGLVECYDPRTGERLWTINSSITPFRIEVDHKGQHVYVGAQTGEIECWDIKSGSLINKTKAHDQAVLQLQAHPTKQQIASAGADGKIKIWNDDLSDLVVTMQSGNSWLNCIAFVPDGSRLLSGNEHTMTCWDSATGREMISISLDRCVHQMSFNHDGSELALASDRRVSDPQDAPVPQVRVLKAPLK